jgi:hypothetical protein
MITDIGMLSCSATVPDMIIVLPSEYVGLSVVTVIGAEVCATAVRNETVKSVIATR